MVLFGPGGAYSPDADVDRHLVVGDESTLPAIAASLERLPTGARAVAFVEVADAGLRAGGRARRGRSRA